LIGRNYLLRGHVSEIICFGGHVSREARGAPGIWPIDVLLTPRSRDLLRVTRVTRSARRGAVRPRKQEARTREYAPSLVKRAAETVSRMGEWRQER
jgi:hypothetical protein